MRVLMHSVNKKRAKLLLPIAKTPRQIQTKALIVVMKNKEQRQCSEITAALLSIKTTPESRLMVD